jgi:hypothetical protein
MLIEPPTYAEQAVMGAYTEAMKGSITAADNAAAAVTTAGFSLATAYGALIGIVQPKAAAGPVALAWPFLGFAVAALLGLAARFFGTSFELKDSLPQIVTHLKDVVRWKQILGGIGATILVVTLVLAGILVSAAYGNSVPAPSPIPSPTVR